MEMQTLTKPVFWVPLSILIVLCYFFVDLPVSIILDQIDQHHPWINKVFTPINKAGLSQPYLFAGVFMWVWALIIAKNKRLAWMAIYFFLSIFISAFICDMIKILAGRARPYEYFSFDIYGFYLWEFDNNFWSFPSGHATTMGALTSACYLVLKRWGALFLILFFLIFAGRVICRAHYLSDVMAGGYLGFLTSFYLYYFLRPKLETKKRNHINSET